MAVNEALCRYFGLTPEQVLGRSFLVLVEADEARRVETELAALTATNPAVVSETRAGPGRSLRWTHCGVFDAAGGLLEIHSFGHDVTREHQFEADAARLAAIVAGADDAIVSKTLEGVVTSWNPAAEALFGFTAAEVLGRSITLIIPSDRLHEETEILARLQRGEKTEHFETERRHKSGRLVPVSVNVSPVRDARGAIIGASKVARDLSAARRAQSDLTAGIRRLEALYGLADRVGNAKRRADVFDAALDAIASALHSDRASVLLFDAAGVMRFVAWRGLSERYRAQTAGHSPWTLGARDPQPIFVEEVAAEASLDALRGEILREGIQALAFIPLVFQEQLLGKFMVYFDRPRAFPPDDRRAAVTIGRHVSFGLARVDGERALLEALERERTARAQADQARADAERASRVKDEFLAMLSHELRNPLGVIRHATAILSEAGGLPPDLGRAVAMVDRQSKHLALLLEDLLDVARITSDHIVLNGEPLDLAAVVSAALEAERVGIVAKCQTLTLDLTGEPLPLVGDALRLQQVVRNLLHNASKYTPAGGRVWVELERDGAQAVLRVRDDGAGIPPDRLEAIFDLFVQGSPTLARTEGGLGIGLTIVRRVVELHRGSVQGRSDGPGQGAEFEVRLPVMSDAGRAPAPASSARLLPARRILVVEDQDEGREALGMILRINGHDVSEAATGHEALLLAARDRPEVVLVDIGLPDLDGYEVARALRSARGTDVRLVALTGYGQPADRDRSRAAGFDAHLVKPVDVSLLLDTLAALG